MSLSLWMILLIIFFWILFGLKRIIKPYSIKWHKVLNIAFMQYLFLFQNKICWKRLPNVKNDCFELYKFLQIYLTWFGALFQKLQKKTEKKYRWHQRWCHRHLQRPGRDSRTEQLILADSPRIDCHRFSAPNRAPFDPIDSPRPPLLIAPKSPL